jgi:hypothetical protein
MNLFVGLAVYGVMVWAFTHERLEFLLSSDERFEFIHPVVPMKIFHAYIAITVYAGVWAVKRVLWDRWRGGRFIPWPQITMSIAVMASFLLPYLFVPLSAMPLAVAIATIYHNIQYFGFVWLFERHRSADIATAQLPLQLPQRLAFEGAWKRFFGMALLFSMAVITIYVSVPKQMGTVLIYFIALSHYLIDGQIWRRDQNRAVAPFIARMSAMKPLPQETADRPLASVIPLRFTRS